MPAKANTLNAKTTFFLVGVSLAVTGIYLNAFNVIAEGNSGLSVATLEVAAQCKPDPEASEAEKTACNGVVVPSTTNCAITKCSFNPLVPAGSKTIKARYGPSAICVSFFDTDSVTCRAASNCADKAGLTSGKTCLVPYHDLNFTAGTGSGVASYVAGKVTKFETDIQTTEAADKYLKEYEILMNKYDEPGFYATLIVLVVVGALLPTYLAREAGSLSRVVAGYAGLALVFAALNTMFVPAGWVSLATYQFVIVLVVLAWTLMNMALGNSRYEVGGANDGHAYGHVIMSHTVGLAITLSGLYSWILSSSATAETEGAHELEWRGITLFVAGLVQTIGCWIWLYPEPGVKVVGDQKLNFKFGLAPSTAGSTQLHERASMLKNSLNIA